MIRHTSNAGAGHPGAGRFAPSPSGDMHVGNLRTALVAWAAARSTGRRFYVRIEDIDEQRSSREAAARQLEDLAAIGIDWDGEVVYQQDRYDAYAEALDCLPTFPCFCSRRDIREAARAPHAAPGVYPGTCRDLDPEQRDRRAAELARERRHPAVRLRAEVPEWRVHDVLCGDYTGVVDDFALRRGGQDTGWAYNLAVVVDDAAQGIDQVVRGDDLLTSAPRQAYLARLLGHPEPEYWHVPLVHNAHGRRLAKRDGAVTLRDLSPRDVVPRLTASLGFPDAGTADEFLAAFDPARLSRAAYVWE